jgi:hypothetical protein
MMTRLRAYKTREDEDHHECHIGLGCRPTAAGRRAECRTGAKK